MGNKAGDRKKFAEQSGKSSGKATTKVDEMDSSSCKKPLQRMILTSREAGLDTRGGVPSGAVLRKDVAELSLVELMTEHSDGLAVMIIDMQVDGQLLERRGSSTVLDHQSAILLHARKLDVPIIDISTHHAGEPKTCSALTKLLDGYEGHYPVVKKTPNAFDPMSYDKKGFATLQGLVESVETVMVIGFDADVCVKSTIFGTHRVPTQSENPELFMAYDKLEQDWLENNRRLVAKEITSEEAGEEDVRIQETRKRFARENQVFVPGLLSLGKTVLTGDEVLVGRRGSLYGPDS